MGRCRSDPCRAPRPPRSTTAVQTGAGECRTRRRGSHCAAWHKWHRLRTRARTTKRRSGTVAARARVAAARAAAARVAGGNTQSVHRRSSNQRRGKWTLANQGSGRCTGSLCTPHCPDGRTRTDHFWHDNAPCKTSNTGGKRGNRDNPSLNSKLCNATNGGLPCTSLHNGGHCYRRLRCSWPEQRAEAATRGPAPDAIPKAGSQFAAAGTLRPGARSWGAAEALVDRSLPGRASSKPHTLRKRARILPSPLRPGGWRC